MTAAPAPASATINKWKVMFSCNENQREAKRVSEPQGGERLGVTVSQTRCSMFNKKEPGITCFIEKIHYSVFPTANYLSPFKFKI